MSTLFENVPTPPSREPLEEGAVLLRGFASDREAALVDAIGAIAKASPFRHLVTPGGYIMSVGMTNCGRVGWVSDRTGYRYDPVDPSTGQPWQPIPGVFLDLAVRAADEAGFPNYDPDACLINRYVAGSKLGLHQDRDEKDQWRRSSRFPWDCPPCSYGAASGAPIRSGGCAWKAGTSRCGAVQRGSSIMGSHS